MRAAVRRITLRRYGGGCGAGADAAHHAAPVRGRVRRGGGRSMLRPYGGIMQSTISKSGNSTRTAVLIAGDTLALLAFAAIGRGNHNVGGGALETLIVAAPFVAAWFPAALLLGAYRVRGLRAIVVRSALAWIVALPFGLGLRALILERGIPLSFAIVTFLVVLALLCGWRALFTILRKERTA